MNIGERIRGLREKQEMTQTELAEKIGSTKQTVYKYENGVVTNIPYDKLILLAKALGTTPSSLMGWDKIEEAINEEFTRLDNLTKQYILLFEMNGYKIDIGDEQVKITDKQKTARTVTKKDFMSMIQYCYIDIENNMNKLLRSYETIS